MRLAKSSRTLLQVAFCAAVATCAVAQEHPNIQPNTVRGQLANPAPADSQAPSAPQTPGQADWQTKPPKTATKGKSPGPKGATKAASGNSTKAGSDKPAEEKTVRRDPFDTLLTKARPSNGPTENLPPGKAGLVVSTLRIDGIIHSPNGMIAIVSNPQQRVYFLREGDKLYDGAVDKIALDAVSFHEFGKDAFGKPLERVVSKRLYPSPGEQQ